MIVDDNLGMRELLRSLLKDLATEIVDYGSGGEAIAHFESEQPDWSVVDIVMHPVDGLTLTSWIKCRFPRARVAVMTQHDNPKLEDKAAEAGADAFFLKENLFALRTCVVRKSKE
jgi:DNA-binding NarL/FixJ family response regulator